MSAEKHVVYKTHKDNFKKEYSKAWLQTLLLGYGFIKLKELNRSVNEGVYKVFNDRIVHANQCIFIKDLKSVKREQSKEQKQFGLADLIVKSETDSLTLIGITGADKLEDVLIAAIKQEEERRKLKNKAEGDYQHFKPGGLEEMNNLVGMWQQGLITDEEFDRQKAGLEKKN
ncbi:MAG: hypothetical protein LAT84_13255 [Balneolia bacterium]|nr:hypothetical protein [Balneolia bacterium]